MSSIYYRKDYFSDFIDVKKDHINRIKKITSRSSMEEELGTVFMEDIKHLIQMHGKEKSKKLVPIYKSFLANVSFFSLKNHEINEKEDKISCTIQIAADIFMTSFTLALKKQESINLFTSKMNRHTANFPPKKKYVYDLEDIKSFSNFMMFNFYDKYELYTRAFAKKKVANFKFQNIGNFGRFPYQLPIDEGEFQGEGEEMVKKFETLKEVFGFKEGLGSRDFGFGFTFEELDWLLGEGVVTSGVNFGNELGERARRDTLRAAYLEGKVDIPEGFDPQEYTGDKAVELIQKFKKLGVKEREDIIKKKMERDRKIKIEAILKREIGLIKNVVDEDLKVLKLEYDIEE